MHYIGEIPDTQVKAFIEYEFYDFQKKYSNIDFFGSDNDNFNSKKIDYEKQNNVSNDVLDEFNKLNGNNSVRLNKKDDFNFFSDAEENE